LIDGKTNDFVLILICSCYPINTILVDFNKLDQYMASHANPYDFSDESSSDSEDDDDSKDGSSSDSSVIIDSF
jgi:hypothetical protein